MSPIRILPDNLINRIAAGEVVERPASIIKELIENALDAGTELVEVELGRGGIDRILVRDHGVGMSKADLFMCIERHATSKLDASADLVSIGTLGFRGEALPSIASVSRMVIRTRPRDADAGHQAVIEYGQLRGIEPVALPVGTEVEVTRLFRNVPARRKFLRTANTEKGHCLQRWTELALAHPAVRFRLTADGKELYNLPPTPDLPVRAQPFFSGIRPADWLRLSVAEPFRIEGLLAPPVLHHAGWNGLFVFVNGRCVRDQTVRYAVLEGYRNQLPARRYPRGIVLLRVLPELVDVNVHPQKAEVRFRNARQIREAVTQSVQELIQPTVVQPRLASPPRPTMPAGRQRPAAARALPLFPAALAGAPARPTPVPPAPVLLPLPDACPGPEYRLAGCLRHSYLVVERSGGTYLVDQHAAHERLLFEKLTQEATIVTQGLLLPYTLDLSPAESLLAKEWLPVFKTLGFVIELFGGNDLMVTAVPAVLGKRAEDRRLLLQVLTDALRERKWTGTLTGLRDHLLKTIACKAAVKAGEPLQPEEMRVICDFVFSDPPHWTCPHGRPLVWEITWPELEKHFAR